MSLVAILVHQISVKKASFHEGLQRKGSIRTSDVIFLHFESSISGLSRKTISINHSFY
jgi:hypothetical protein